MFPLICFIVSIILIIAGIMGYLLGYLPAQSKYLNQKNKAGESRSDQNSLKVLKDNREAHGWISGLGFAVGVIMLIIIFFAGVAFSIGRGEVAVAFNPLGKSKLADGTITAILPGEYGEGLNFKAPWVSTEIFNVKTQDYTMVSSLEEGQTTGQSDTVKTITNEGLSVGLDITVLYRIDPTKADVIRRTIGKDGEYQVIVVRPTIRSTIRDVVAGYTAYDIYGPNKDKVQDDIFTKLESLLKPRNIIIESVLLRDTDLPEELKTAITLKKQAEQDAQRMDYVIQQEEKEKERKIIEAEGIAEANRIIAGSLSENYLKWYWIDEVSGGDNVMYIPVGENGLPIFKEVSDPTDTVSEPVTGE